MKSWVTIALTIGLFLAGCGPSDQHVLTVRDRVMAGEYVEFKENGKSFCGPFVAWTDMRVSDVSERQRIIVQKQKSFVQPGWDTCYRVGDTIAISVNGNAAAGAGGGFVRITSIGFVLLDKLYGKNASENLKGSYFKSTDNLDKYKAGKRLYPEMEGVVTVVNFEYLPGTAADEEAVKKADREESETDAYREVVAEGETLGKCSKIWEDYEIKPELLDAVKNGELRSSYRMGTQNCVKVGAEIGLRTGKVGEPSQLKVKVLRVKSFRTKFLAAKFFSLNGYKWDDLKALIDGDLAKKPSEFMNAIDFEYVGEVTP